MSRVAVVFTGGTISMASDPIAGGNIPMLDGAAIIARTPGLGSIADVVAIDRGRTPASHFSFATLFEIAAELRDILADPIVDGAVVVQGTDTIEETSFVWDLLSSSPKPVVVTGAMRASDQDGFDGPANLRDAVRVAVAPSMRGAGVVVCLAGTIEPADDVVKMHTSSLGTFQSPNGGSLGAIRDGDVVLSRDRGARRSVAATEAAERVHLLTVTIGMDGTLLDAAVSAGADAIVVAATGSGNTTPAVLEAAKRAMDRGIPVVLASRCPGGEPAPAYAFPGGGVTWVAAGAIPVGRLCAVKARIAVALGLGAGLDRAGLQALLADPQSSNLGSDATR
jgi:L-asparaginase